MIVEGKEKNKKKKKNARDDISSRAHSKGVVAYAVVPILLHGNKGI